MDSISDFPYFEVQFTKEAKVYDPEEPQKLFDFLDRQEVTDLFVISHGWNNNIQEARELYQRLFTSMRETIDQGIVPGIETRKFAILAVFWPSKKFTERELIAGGAAGLEDTMVSEVRERVTTLQELLADPEASDRFERLKALVPKLEDSPSARKEFVDSLRKILDRGETDDEDASTDFFELDSEEVMDRLQHPLASPAANDGEEEGGVAEIGDFTPESGGAAGFLNFSGFTAAAGNLLNFATYYEMKQRAGNVGRKGLNPLLREIRQKYPAIKQHLVGHSFGGRLVTATVLGTEDFAPAETLSLLQAAFSHYGFAKDFEPNKNGFFRKVVENQKVSGPILITHTKNDWAVGIAYPIASALSRDDSSFLGDENDRFGGIGRNGAQKTPEAIRGLSLLPVGGSYPLQAGKLHNLRADEFIQDHGDVGGLQVAYAILTAVATT
ncbi:hypothetical protein V0288_21860 [Pannus brasiliensis CCIBt3594]|uniref:Alpha/beta hydrolase n=1 Tax=Pannus brasiliensis CCIBt3594 TaxID=1427578 RepID=A0AAW9QX20_9CHRO